MRPSFFLMLATLFVNVGGATAQQTSSEPEAALPPEKRSASSAIDSVLEGARQRHSVPAMAAVVVRSDTVSEVSTVGVRRQGRAARLAEDDRLHVGSNTKAMTATLIAQLIREGTLEWSTTVGEAFPDFERSIAEAYRDVTLEELLSHQAGVPPFTDGAEFEKLPAFDGSPKKKRKAFAKWLLSRQPEHKPGTKFSYSNAGYAIAAAMAEQATGNSWETMLRERLFEPLGIAGGFGWPAASDPEQPWGHWTEESDTLRSHDPNGSYRLETFVAPAGDVNMSPGDYAQFLRLHLRGLQGRKTKLLNPAMLRYLHEGKIDMGSGTGGSSYALGWNVQELLGAQTSTHTGSAGTFYTLTTIQPSRNLALAVFANAGNEETVTASTEVLVALLKRYRSTRQRSQEK